MAHTIAAGLTVMVSLITFPASGAETPRHQAVARVGERVITRAMLDDAVTEALNQRYFHRRLDSERRLELEREQLKNLIRRELNRYGGLDRDLSPPLEDAERRRAQIEQRLGEDQYRSALEVAGLDPQQHAAAIADTLLAEQAYHHFVVENAKVTDATVRDAYEANPGRWRMPESIHVQHLMLKLALDDHADRVVERERETREIISRLEQGEDFATLASQRSEDMYRVKAGDLGWVHRGRLLPPVEEAVWNAEPGQIVGPIRSESGIHVARVLERRPERQLSLDEVEQTLRKELAATRLRESEERWFTALKTAHPVIVLAPELMPVEP